MKTLVVDVRRRLGDSLVDAVLSAAKAGASKRSGY
jgi:hypothetical protein